MFKETPNQFEDLGDGVYYNRQTKKVKVMYEGWEIVMQLINNTDLKTISEVNYSGGEHRLTKAMHQAVLEKVRYALEKAGILQ
jgi:hypothetical protein